MLDFIKEHKKIIIGIIIAAILLCAGAYWYLLHKTATQEQPKVMEYDNTTKPPEVKDMLDVSDKTAGDIVRQIEYIHDGRIVPEATYSILAPTLTEAATETAKQIKVNDTSLPAAATEKTDRTIVTTNTDKQQVDVYKIDLDKQHQIKVGAGVVDSHTYEVVSYQAGRWEVPIVTQGKNIKGGAILYTAAKW